MRILIDTNVFLDFILKREPFFRQALSMIDLCRKQIVQGAISAQSAADIYYILRKHYSVEQRKRILLDICQFMDVVSIGKEQLVFALRDTGFPDFEDCLQAEGAGVWGADYIITRNGKHFVHSKIPVITPEEFCNHYPKNEFGT
ncbi:MAG: PIN domain-containing protein [Schwartzia sp.]|nr:PIN domain-containing protein [Schwartzia sp. (in: firmicutes)]